MRFPPTVDAGEARKLTEATWKLGNIQNEVKITIKEWKPRSSQKKDPIRQTKRFNQGSVHIATGESSFGDVIRNLKEKVNLRELGVDMRDYRQTKDGLRLNIRERTKGAQERLTNLIKNELNLKAEAKGPIL